MGDIRGLTETVTQVQPTPDGKHYRCPGCQGSIGPMVFHLVVIPDDRPELRRHWHVGCWDKELRRRGPAEGIPD